MVAESLAKMIAPTRPSLRLVSPDDNIPGLGDLSRSNWKLIEAKFP